MRIAILISGRGSNMDALLEAATSKAITVALIAANQPCEGLKRATAAGFPTALMSRSDYDSKQAHEAALSEVLQQATPDWIFLAGYMALLSADFIASQHQRIINIHPSLLPAYKGLNTHQRAIDDRAVYHGVSIHLVTTDMDAGTVLVQAGIQIDKKDSAKSLAMRLLKVEHILYPAVLLALFSGNLTISFISDNAKPTWHCTSNLPQVGEADICLIKTTMIQ